MRSVLYTNVMLTVIALLLAWIAIRPMVMPEDEYGVHMTHGPSTNPKPQ